eukprot:gnl/TRDRNA2_/TRDRNA2_40322_c0_seq1.p1 gnl/TRDRNA2_/TRDRNA2_40322_c0~~gnl/TRDRNA2_/TRDRNA2_40322_c0_seq1.p1  ORF type:complete len:340 (-),score=51.87 gnl/TRDRNA2_/TRDRNA2_40322_c0_seq1:71-1090(-)
MQGHLPGIVLMLSSLMASAVPAHGEEFATKPVGKVQNSVPKMMGRMHKKSPIYDLDGTMLAKTSNLAIPSTSMSRLPAHRDLTRSAQAYLAKARVESSATHVRKLPTQERPVSSGKDSAALDAEPSGLSRRDMFAASFGVASSLLSAPALAQDASEKTVGQKVGKALEYVQAVINPDQPAYLAPTGDINIMAQKAHGTCSRPVEQKLRWNADLRTADKISCYNRFFAEYAGYWEKTSFLSAERGAGDDGSSPVTFYDSVTGKKLFVAPIGRSWAEFVAESKVHGWPSFRDEEVVSQNVRVLADGETVSVDGTHLGHNLPDSKGNRYCINLVSVAGYPEA